MKFANVCLILFLFISAAFVGETGAKVSAQCQSIQRQIDNQYKRIQNLQDQLARGIPGT